MEAITIREKQDNKEIVSLLNKKKNNEYQSEETRNP